MVYDRGRSAREVHGGASAGTSGSPRSRFAPENSSFAQKQGSTRPHEVQCSNAPMVLDDDLLNPKVLIDLISERVSWYIQRDNADKKNRKLRHDLKRCQNGEFPSAVDMLDVRLKALDLDKAKFSQRMTIIDDKLLKTTSAWCSKLESATQPKSFSGNGRHDLTPPPSETSSDINLSIDEKLAQLREDLEVSMRNQITEALQKLQCEVKSAYDSRTTTLHNDMTQEAQKLLQARNSIEVLIRNQITEQSQKLQYEIKDSYESRTANIQNHVRQESQKLSQMRSNVETMIRKQFAEESRKLQSKTEDKYEAQLASLRQDLLQEKDVAKRLEAKLNSMAAKLAAVETKVDDQAKISSQLDLTVKQEAFVDLESRLAKFEASQMSTNQPTKKDDAEDHKIEVEVDSAQPPKLDSIMAQSPCLELNGGLQEKLTQFLQNGDGIVSEKMVLCLVQAVETRLQSTLSHMAEKFGTLIEKERAERVSLGVQVKGTAQSISATAQAVEALHAELIKVQAASVANRQSDVTASMNQETRIQNLTELLSSTKDDIQSAIKGELQKSVDALWLRTANMQSWQDNFNTIELFNAIVQHLNNSFVSDHFNTLIELRARVINLEGGLGDGGNKKRKLAEPSPLPFPPVARR